VSASAAPEHSQQREELARLQQGLATRDSTEHFAHAGVSVLASLILFGATAKMIWDAGKLWILPLASGSVACALVTYALVRYLRGRRTYQDEMARYERMMAIRRDLKLDDPAALLPQR
jgi:hypothetical protein